MEFNGTFLATIVTFIVFVILMNKVLYAPILGIMEERKKFIDENYKAAKENDEKALELANQNDKKIAEAKDAAREKYNGTLDEFKEKRAEIIAEAKSDAKDELEKSKVFLENVSNEAKLALRASMTNLANDIVEKVIGYHSEVQSFDEEAVNNILWENN